MQDVVHIGVKFKARLLNTSVKLTMGSNFEASVYHLEQLCATYGKEQHFLRERDLNHKDKQNFDAVLHIIHASRLLDGNSRAYATKCYIEVIQNVIDNYLDKSLDPISRIEKISYATFFLRYWRKWILLHPLYTLKTNFITQNCYMCVELNAHALVTYILTIRDHFKGSNNFLPWLLGSQTCERTFRTVRSMSSTFSTVLNFSILGLLRRLHRLNIQLNLQASTQDTIKFPNIEKHRIKEGKNKLSQQPLTEVKDEDIAQAIQKAKNKAKTTLETLGMDKLFQIHSIWEKDDTTEDLRTHMDDTDDLLEEEEDDDDNDETEEIHDDSLKNTIIEEVCLETQNQIESDLNSAYNEGLVNNEVKEKLQKIQLPIERITSDTIPMFSLKQHSSIESCLSNFNTKQVFTPFVEVNKRTCSSYQKNHCDLVVPGN